MTSPLRLGWIGCGTHANEMLLPQVTRHDVVLHAICDISPESLASTGRRYGVAPEDRRRPDISPLYADLRGLPPARFVVGTQDPLLDDTLFMAARWEAAGNTTSLEVVAEAAHGFIQFPLEVAERELTAQEEFVAKSIT